MKFNDLFEKWKLTGLKIKTGFAEMEWKPGDADKDAAWELYVELLTRITTQALPAGQGTEEAALQSLHSLFNTTREVLKRYGRECVEMSKVAVIVLNQVLRPFTSEWHKRISDAPLTAGECLRFREELSELQPKLVAYCHLLADIAGVEDITELENPDPR